jgi:hypothetical protein
VQFPNGQSFEQTFVALLQQYGYQGSYKSADWLRKPVFIQSFATTALQKAAQSTDLPLVFLYDSPSLRTQDTNQVTSRTPRPSHPALQLTQTFGRLIVELKHVPRRSFRSGSGFEASSVIKRSHERCCNGVCGHGPSL